jgi:hypothetical protein
MVESSAAGPAPPEVAPTGAAGAAGAGALEAFLNAHGNAVLLTLCLLAGIRVLAYSSAFPLYANMDEQSHLDLVLKYAKGRVPGYVEPFSPESGLLIVRYGSPEYLSRPGELPGGTIPPPFWSLARTPQIVAAERDLVMNWATSPNHESTGPPLYYAVAALWYRLGMLFGLEGGRAVYWIRYLNAAAWALLVWMSWNRLGHLFPRKRLLQFGVPLLLVVFPQDVVYCINNDALSPLLFAAAFFALLDVARGVPGPRTHIAAGALAACAFLVKVSSVAIAGMLVAVCLLRLKGAHRAETVRDEWPRLALLAASAASPVLLWMGRNLAAAGDLTGSTEKVKALGWSLKPMGEWLNHPLFGLAGLATFWNGVTATMWRGELVWHRSPMEWPALDRCYALATLAVVTTMSLSLFWRGARWEPMERTATAMSLTVGGLSLLLLAVLSVAFDFGNCVAPSREVPFLTSGRLISGNTVPLFFLLVAAVDLVSARLGCRRYAWIALLAVAASIGASELALSLPVFASPYNALHLAG